MKNCNTCSKCKHFRKIGGVYRSGYCLCKKGKWYFKRVDGYELWQGSSSKACEYFEK